MKPKRQSTQRATAERKGTPTRGRAKAAYVPPAIGELATAERKLLAVLADPRNLGKTAVSLSDAAGVGRTTYYRLLQNPEFQRKRNEVLIGVLRDVSPALGACMRTAEIEGREGAQDRKLLFEIAGIYKPRLTVEESRSARVDGDMPDEEALWWYLNLKYSRDLWLPSIRQRYDAGQINPKKPPHLEAGASDAP